MLCVASKIGGLGYFGVFGNAAQNGLFLTIFAVFFNKKDTD